MLWADGFCQVCLTQRKQEELNFHFCPGFLIGQSSVLQGGLEKSQYLS